MKDPGRKLKRLHIKNMHTVEIELSQLTLSLSVGFKYLEGSLLSYNGYLTFLLLISCHNIVVLFLLILLEFNIRNLSLLIKVQLRVLD